MNPNQDAIMVSACLLGIHCRYDGSAKPSPELIEILSAYRVIPFCPETLGGLTALRPPAEIQHAGGAEVLLNQAKVCNRNGQDCTSAFIQGAEKVLEMARQFHPRVIILKAKSPSCGVGQVYDGSFSGKLRSGDGVTSALLRREGLNIFNEVEFITNPSQILSKNGS